MYLHKVDQPIKFQQTGKNICEKIILHMNQIMQLAVNIGIGSCVLEIEQIYRSYEEAETALEYHYIMGKNSVMEMEMIQKEKKSADMNMLFDLFILHIKENNRDEIEKDSRSLFKNTTKSANTNIQIGADGLQSKITIAIIFFNITKKTVLENSTDYASRLVRQVNHDIDSYIAVGVFPMIFLKAIPK